MNKLQPNYSIKMAWNFIIYYIASKRLRILPINPIIAYNKYTLPFFSCISLFLEIQCLITTMCRCIWHATTYPENIQYVKEGKYRHELPRLAYSFGLFVRRLSWYLHTHGYHFWALHGIITTTIKASKTKVQVANIIIKLWRIW